VPAKIARGGTLAEPWTFPGLIFLPSRHQLSFLPSAYLSTIVFGARAGPAPRLLLELATRSGAANKKTQKAMTAVRAVSATESARSGRHGIDGNRSRHGIGCGNRTQRSARRVERDHLKSGGTRHVDRVSHARHRKQAAGTCEVERRARCQCRPVECKNGESVWYRSILMVGSPRIVK
jgi:hypothetical protein